jgi:hypothetical protein
LPDARLSLLPDALSLLPDPFAAINSIGWLVEAAEGHSPRRLQSYLQMLLLLSKERRAGSCPPAFTKTLDGKSDCRSSPRAIYAGEKRDRAVESLSRSGGDRVPARDEEPPAGRHTAACSGERAAIPRRSEIDHSCGLGKPRECHAMMETASTAYAATPTRDDTLALVPRDRRGRPGGGRGRLRGPRRGSRTLRPPPSRPRSGSIRPARCRPKDLPCLPAFGVSVLSSTANAALSRHRRPN